MPRICGCGRKYARRQGLSNHIKKAHDGIAPSGTVVLKKGRPKSLLTKDSSTTEKTS